MIPMRLPGRPAARRGERGAVLIVCMIFLIILTLLAVSGMGTTQLEERMASNTQEVFRAFEAAESALAEGVALVEEYDLNNPLLSPPDFLLPGTDHDMEYRVDWVGMSPPPKALNDPTLLSAVECFEAANFNVRGEGKTGGNIVVTINGGTFQVKKIPGKC